MLGNKEYNIKYLSLVVREDIPLLSKTVKNRIKVSIENKLVYSPDLFGKPLRRSLKGFRSLRVGDYRVIYFIERSTVLIVIIKHRSVVYSKMKKRL